MSPAPNEIDQADALLVKLVAVYVLLQRARQARAEQLLGDLAAEYESRARVLCSEAIQLVQQR